eukprot:CAMPEP_0118963118 /NCGR_PEP_ID=MMETSP1173-20130426/1168_1 /TAXON_ID=1034831 /ORGANISM="Rhizochromulina marina cf, Strain CCMP1243" /LENGTH=110 /DNA_ID=CAMNT_0006911433 /DNA_START=24 /DNA_END=356 /DNA_ORIENTATION=+
MALRQFAIAETKPAVKLFRDIAREIPRVLTIFDIDLPADVVRGRVAGIIRQNSHVKDDRVVRALVNRGYLELEETCLQHKTRHQLLNKIDPIAKPGAAKPRSLLDEMVGV